MDARRLVQRVDLEAGVVCHADQPRRGRVIPRLHARVLAEGRPGLLRFIHRGAVAERDQPGRRALEYAGDLLQFSWIGGRNQQRSAHARMSPTIDR
jgi:hypothetical protein